MRNLMAILWLNISYHWYCNIRRRPDLFIPVLNRELDAVDVLNKR